jgi:hypothetical protein
MRNDTSPDLDVETGWSKTVAEQIARSIKIARRRKKTSWAILQGNPGVHLNVGQRSACEMDQSRAIILVDIADLSRSGRRLGENCRILDWRDENKDHSNLRKIEFPIMSARQELRILQRSHEIAIFDLAEKATPFRVDHCPELLDLVARVGGIPIDRPEYSDHLIARRK